MECVDSFPEYGGVLSVGGVDVEDYGGGGKVGEGFDCDGDDGGEGARSSACKSPEEVRVGLGVCDEELAGGGYYFEGEGLVGGWRRVENKKWGSMSEEDEFRLTHSVERRERTMTSTLDVPSSETNSLWTSSVNLR